FPPELPAGIGGVGRPLVDEADVLDEGAAEGDVQHLDPTAHAEDRQLLVERPLDELELEGVPVRVRRGELRVRLLTVASGLDVAAAAEDDAVADLEDVGQVPVGDPRKRQRQPTGEGDGPLEPDGSVLAEVEQADGEAYHGFPRARHYATFLSQRRLESRQ